MEELKIAQVKVRERQRKSLDGIEELAESMRRVGLIHPIAIDKDGYLLAGERRLTAAKLLQWETIPTTRFEELSEVEKKEIELEENIRRKDLTWQEEVSAKLELDKLKKELYGSAYPGQMKSGWSSKDTAMSLGESPGNTSMDLQVARALSLFPQLRTAPSKTKAYKQYKSLLDTTMRQALASEKNLDNKMAEMYDGDCLEIMKGFENESVDLIITDPPYGIDLQNSEFKGNQFADSEKTLTNILECTLEECYRLLKEGSHMYWFFAPQKYNLVSSMLEKSQLEYEPIPCIWYKGDNVGKPPVQSKFRTVYDSFFFCWKGNPRPLARITSNLFYIKPVYKNKVHVTQKPYELGRVLCELSSVKGETILDPFAGSGALLEPAYKLGRRVVGIDIKYYPLLFERFNNESPASDD